MIILSKIATSAAAESEAKRLGIALYRDGLRQHATRLTMQLMVPQAVDFTRLDALVKTVFGVDMVALSPPALPGVEWAWRILQLAAGLLQAAGLPVFDPGRVLAVQPDPETSGRWLVQVSVVQVSSLSRKDGMSAYRWAAKLLEAFAAQPPTALQRDKLCQKIQQELLKPLQAKGVRGKSMSPILRAADALGEPFMSVGAGLYQLGWGSRSRRISRSVVESDSSLGAELANNKWSAALVLRRAGLPAPVHVLVKRPEDLQAAADALGWPVVVKPADRDRGEGVVLGIANTEALQAAYDVALKWSRQILVERQVSGWCHRILVSHGAVLYVGQRLPKLVTGDGVQRVSALIEAANADALRQPVWSRLEVFPSDAMALQCLREQGHTLESIPALGQRVHLRPTESTAWGSDTLDLSAEIHPDNVRAAIDAARLLGLTVAGVDMISPDISQPWHANGAIINEVNVAPLLGGSALSLACLPAFVRDLLPAGGRIPVELVIGDKSALAVVKAKQQRWLDQGLACFWTSHIETQDAQGSNLPMTFNGLALRGNALLMNTTVDALVLWLQTDELQVMGSPVDRFSAVDVVPGVLYRYAEPAQALSSAEVAALVSWAQGLVSDC
ncbi:MAG: hypothetical protein HQ446_02440 [Polaromonas sp.]|nr:hypothetical protein [Polaromonas sp.]